MTFGRCRVWQEASVAPVSLQRLGTVLSGRMSRQLPEKGAPAGISNREGTHRGDARRIMEVDSMYRGGSI